MQDQLKVIEKKDLPLLRDLYKPGGTRSYTAYVTIDTYIRWFQQDPDITNVEFYCLNGDISHGTFVVTDNEIAIAYADTFNESNDELFRLLMLLDYSRGYFFPSLSDRIGSIVREVIKKRGIELGFNDTNLNYFLPKEEALKLDIQLPDGIDLKPLKNVSDIEKAHSAYIFKDNVPVKFLIRQAKYNPSFGAFTKDGTLVAWVFRLPTGLLLDLQTDKEYLGHGYGSLVTKALSKCIAEMGHDVYAGIFEGNTPSRNLFGKIGFKPIGNFNWVGTKINRPTSEE